MRIPRYVTGELFVDGFRSVTRQIQGIDPNSILPGFWFRLLLKDEGAVRIKQSICLIFLGFGRHYQRLADGCIQQIAADADVRDIPWPTQLQTKRLFPGGGCDLRLRNGQHLTDGAVKRGEQGALPVGGKRDLRGQGALVAHVQQDGRDRAAYFSRRGGSDAQAQQERQEQNTEYDLFHGMPPLLTH